jgi:digeranylgeranylglycerophospholipid reductase
MKEYDLIVAGAGFAGLACAGTAARNNLNTLVLERSYDIEKNIHTTGILVKEIAEEWNLPARLTKKINGVRLYSPALDWIDLYSPGYYFLATDMPGLMRWQLQQAKTAGVKIYFESPYKTSEYLDSRHVFTNENIKCRYLVGCDGARSRVAKQYNLGRNRDYLIGIEAEYEILHELDQDKLHIFLDADLASGYIAWIVPGLNCTQVGLATRFPKAPRLQDFIKKVSPLFNLDKLQPGSHRAGAIPCGGPVNKYFSENIMLLGDAAGMVSPLTAGGIHPAVRIGRIAGEAIADYLNNDAMDPGCIVDKSLPRFFYKKMFRHLSDKLIIPNTVYNHLFSTTLFRSLAQTIFFHHRGLFSMAAWRDFTRILINHP